MSKIKDLIPDNKNYNNGNEFGNSLIEKSLRNLGAGRSILIDKNNRIIAGNKTVENAVAIGLEDMQIVESDGTKIIAVKRTDIDLDSKKGRELALADNASAKANIVWNHENLKEDWGDDELKGWGIEEIITDADNVDSINDGEEIIFSQSAQIEPPKEYILIMTEPNSTDWEDLKLRLKLKMVRRGGYKEGSAFDSVSIERVITWAELKDRANIQ